MNTLAERKRPGYVVFLQYGLLFAVLFFICSVSRVYEGDDLIFVEATNGQSLFSWIGARYLAWSGRIFTESCLYLVFHGSIALWYIITPLALMLLAWSIVRIFKEKPSFWEVVVSTCLLLMMQGQIFASSVLWMTGAICYLWPAAIGAVAMIPYADAVFRGKTSIKKSTSILCTVALLAAALGTEQITACLLGFMVCAHIYLIVKKQKISPRYYLMPVGMIAGLVVIALCPGNAVRMLSEEASWYPGFFDLSMTVKLGRTVAWMFEKIFVLCRLPVFLLSAVVLYAAFRRQGDGRRNVAVRTVFLSLFLFSLGVQFLQVTAFAGVEFPLYNFALADSLLAGTLPAQSATGAMILFPFLYWSGYALFLILTLLDSTKRKGFYLLCFLACVLSLLMMVASPTIYGSGNRLEFVFYVIIAMVMVSLLQEQGLLASRYVILAAAILAAANIGNLLYIFKDGFYVIY